MKFPMLGDSLHEGILGVKFDQRSEIMGNMDDHEFYALWSSIPSNMSGPIYIAVVERLISIMDQGSLYANN